MVAIRHPTKTLHWLTFCLIGPTMAVRSAHAAKYDNNGTWFLGLQIRDHAPTVVAETQASGAREVAKIKGSGV